MLSRPHPADKTFRNEARVYPISAELTLRISRAPERSPSGVAMKNRGFKSRLVRLVCTGSAVLSATVMAQPPETGPNKKPRSRPQVIYHLPPNNAATLHSQAKGQNNDAPVESGTPAAAQGPRDNPNAATALQQQAPRPAPQESKVTRQTARPRSVHKPPGQGNPHGNKSHKK